MKTVVFASVNDAARSQMAAAFFNAFSAPSLVRAISGGDSPLLQVSPEVVEVMKEVGHDIAAARPHPLTAGVLQDAVLLVAFADARSWAGPQGIRREEWDVLDPAGQPLARIREIRDRLRRLVWRMVARHGWYKLQPSVALTFREKNDPQRRQPPADAVSV